jgi:hypothetical protein
MPKINLCLKRPSTITLKRLVHHALNRQFRVEESRVFYDPNISRKHHFFHLGAGETETKDIDAEKFTILGMLQLPPDKSVARVVVFRS